MGLLGALCAGAACATIRPALGPSDTKWERTYRYALGGHPIGAARIVRDGDLWRGEDDLASIGMTLATETALSAGGEPSELVEAGRFNGQHVEVRLRAAPGEATFAVDGDLRSEEERATLRMVLPRPSLFLETNVLAHWAIAAARCLEPRCTFTVFVPSVQLRSTLSLEEEEISGNGERHLLGRVGPVVARLVVDGAGRLASLEFDGGMTATATAADADVHASPISTPPSRLLSPSRWREEEVKVNGVAGVVARPATGYARYPAALLFSEDDRDANGAVGQCAPLADVARSVAAAGAVTLRIAQISGAPTFAAQYLEPAAAALALLRARSDVDPSQIYLIGHGLGALAALRLASTEQVAGLVLLAPTAEPPDTQRERLAYAATLRGASARQLVSLGAKAHAPQWWDALDPLEFVRASKVPTLVVNGAVDPVAPPDQVATLVAALGAPSLETMLLPRLNHELVEIEGESDGSEYEVPGVVASGVLERVARFVAGAE